MKYIRDDLGMDDADDADDAIASTVRLEQQIDTLRREIETLPEDHRPVEKHSLLVQVAGNLLDLDRTQEAWEISREALDVFVQEEEWEQAAVACEVMFISDQPESLAALGQGIWLAVTYPVDPELTVALLQHIVEETPDDSDGAAVAAATAVYVVDIRVEDEKQKADLEFFTNNMMGEVARRHSSIENQDDFDAWVKKLELSDPGKFLVRLRNVVDVMVQEDWWFDREALQAELPVH